MTRKTFIFILISLIAFVSCAPSTSSTASGNAPWSNQPKGDNETTPPTTDPEEGNETTPPITDPGTGSETDPEEGNEITPPITPEHPYINVDALNQTTWTGTNPFAGGTWVAVKFVKTGPKTLDAYFGEGGDEGTAIRNMVRFADTHLDPTYNELSFDQYKFLFKSDARSLLVLGNKTISDNLAKKNN